jgi:P27 family predicted phage terminase small subunit
MARKSAAALATVVVDPMARPDAPGHLTEAQRHEWTRIVHSLPADYFRPADYPLLEAYCCASALHRDASQRVEKEGFIALDRFGEQRPHPAVAVVKQASAAMASMATKLRLCPSARYGERKAETLTRPVANLWQRRSGV